MVVYPMPAFVVKRPLFFSEDIYKDNYSDYYEYNFIKVIIIINNELFLFPMIHILKIKIIIIMF